MRWNEKHIRKIRRSRKRRKRKRRKTTWEKRKAPGMWKTNGEGRERGKDAVDVVVVVLVVAFVVFVVGRASFGS